MTTKHECDRCGEQTVNETDMMTYENSHGAEGHLCGDCEDDFKDFLGTNREVQL